MSESGEGSCPACGKPARRASDNPYRPFCSDRCKMSDLGDWFAERYAIPGDDDPATDPGTRSQ